jgi:hypothetical protein
MLIPLTFSIFSILTPPPVNFLTRKHLCFADMMTMFQEIVKLAQPVFMGMLISYFRFDSKMSLQDAYLAAGGVALCAALAPLIHHPYFYALQKYGMRIKIGCGGLIMDKVRMCSFLLSNEIQNSASAGDFSMMFTKTPALVNHICAYHILRNVVLDSTLKTDRCNQYSVQSHDMGKKIDRKMPNLC